MSIEPWQAPLLVMAAIILVESAYDWARQWTHLPNVPHWARLLALSLLTLFAGGVALWAWGPTLAGNLVTVFTGIATYLTLMAYRPPRSPLGEKVKRAEDAGPG